MPRGGLCSALQPVGLFEIEEVLLDVMTLGIEGLGEQRQEVVPFKL